MSGFENVSLYNGNLNFHLPLLNVGGRGSAGYIYDGLGRTVESRQYESATAFITTTKTYDALGRTTQGSNPYRSGDAILWTTTAYDALGRVLSVTTPDNAVVSTSYSGNTVTVTDQAGKKRKSETDALGRLKKVYEDPTGSLNYLTSYGYDVLDNLTTVTQDAQTRTFVYDSLKRLKSATNPESGTVNYTYDNNGNLLTKTDARPINTTVTYDALNRPTFKDYSDTTPDVAYFYDAQVLPAGAPSFNRGSSTGRLVAVTTGGTSAGTYRGYNGLGHVTTQYQRTDSVNYLVEATYNAAGGIKTETFPAVPGAGDRRTVTYTPNVAGRLSSLNSNATSYAPAASISGISYAASGGLSSETYGNNLIHAVTYNNRSQTSQIKLGTVGAPTSIVSLTYTYGTITNSGNLQSLSYAGGGLSYTQTYGYDQLNRLTTSQEGASWSQTNSYDRYGNRAVVGGALTFNANNRITTAGYTYDAAGNLTNDGLHSYAFDGENKISKVDNVPAYVYDGEGQRVRKLVNENLRFIYGIGGHLMAEFSGTGALKKEYIYAANGTMITIEPPAANANGTRYTTSDHLGSPRVVTNSAAGVVSRHDYMPFGEELFNGGRTVGMGYGVADGLRQKFTSKEQDSETGLDYFGARYYGSTQGRFTSADPLMLGLKQVVNPQRWNRYTYVVNNPLALYDPDGQDDQGQGGSKIIDVFIAMPPDGQQDYRTVNRRPAGNYPSPDWSKLQENAAKAGYTVNVHQLSGSTPEAVANSFRTAELTVIVGHGVDLDPQNLNKFTSDAAAISGGLVGVGGIQPATVNASGRVSATGEATPVSGTGVVGLFTCNSTDVLSAGFRGQTVVSNDGGPDGLTTVGTLQQSAFGFVGTYVDTGGNVNASVATGQRVINNAANRVVNDPAANGARATNAGDRLHLRVRRREEE